MFGSMLVGNERKEKKKEEFVQDYMHDPPSTGWKIGVRKAGEVDENEFD